jgi:hypothetical protein
MAVSRYDNRPILFNNSEIYENVFQRRGIKHVSQYGTPVIDFPLAEEIRDLKLETHTWKSNDSFYKLAYEHYDDPSYWWIIPWFNKKPTEFHFQLGDLVYIPGPLIEVLVVAGF